MNPYIKILTERITSYLNLSAEEKKAHRQEIIKKRRQRQDEHQSQYANKWLGIFPFVMKTIFKK